jgi:hypothetical protein
MAPGLAYYGFDPAGHLQGCAPGEGKEQDALRRDPMYDQMRNPVRKRHGLACPGPCYNEQRSGAECATGGLSIGRRLPLCPVQGAQVIRFKQTPSLPVYFFRMSFYPVLDKYTSSPSPSRA